MKKLTKIKLINWYTFQNETIEIKGNSLVTGINGSGKSTLLDAIQYILTGGKPKFNKAAGDGSKRTLETYVKGKLGLNNKEYLRSGDVTAYIALEFYDELNKSFDVVGAVIEFVKTNSRFNRSFFKISNSIIDDSIFIQSNAPKTINKFKQNSEIKFFDTISEIQSMLSSTLGIYHEKYSELLTKALAFKPIEDVNEFVNTFLLTEDNVSLENLQSNVEHFRQLQDIIEKEEEKIVKLEQIESSYKDYDEKINEINKNQILLDKINLLKVINEIKNSESQINKLKSDVELINQTINNLDERRDEIKDKILEYNISLKDNNEYNLYENWKNTQEKLSTEIKTLKNKVDNFNNTLIKEKEMLDSFAWSKDLGKIDVNSNIANINEILNKCVLKLNDEKTDLCNKQATNCRNIKILEKKLKDIKDKLSLLSQKKLPYFNKSVTVLQEIIKKSLKEKYGKNIEIRPLCEYIDITEEKWRNSIEGYLNTQRFDLIIDPKYFDEALRIYEQEKQQNEIYGVGLVNTGKLEEVNVKENSLASYITSDNIYALRYAKYLLNRVICCESVDDLKNYPQAITATCMLYKNYTARQINPDTYNYYYIGQKALEQQLIKYEEERANCEFNYNETIAINNVINKHLTKIDSSALDNLIKMLPSIQDYNSKKLEYQKNEEYVSSLKVSGFISNAMEQKKDLEIELEKINNERKNADNQKIDIISNIKNIENKLNDLLEEKNKLNEVDNKFDSNFKDLNGIKEADVLKHIKQIEEQRRIIQNKILMLEGEYNNKFQFDQIPSIDNVNYYLQELYNIRETDMKKHKSNSLEFQEKCQISFREDFISKLKNKIMDAQDQLKHLNRSLKDKTFGRDTYEFVCTCSEDLELAKYYKIIMSGDNYQINSLFESNLNLEDKDTMDELFNKITSSNTKENALKTINEYTDYRKYMSYDIKITNENGDVYYFSKVSKEKSGGEKQTPFYVIIAACFEQLLKSAKKGSSVGCFVMFDEAFNTMDESRIEAMMEFYNNLHIQLMIVVPPQRITTIFPYVNTSLLVMKQHDDSYVKSITKEEIELYE